MNPPLEVTIKEARQEIARLLRQGFDDRETANAALQCYDHLDKALTLIKSRLALLLMPSADKDTTVAEIPTKFTEPPQVAEPPPALFDDPKVWPTPQGDALVVRPAGPAPRAHIIFVGIGDEESPRAICDYIITNPKTFLERGNMIPDYCTKCARKAGLTKPYTNQGQSA